MNSDRVLLLISPQAIFLTRPTHRRLETRSRAHSSLASIVLTHRLVHNFACQCLICRRDTLEGASRSEEACTSQQEHGSLYFVHRLQLELVSEAGHGLRAGSEEDMPSVALGSLVFLAALWQVVLHHSQIVRVVEDQQPPMMGLQPLHDRLHYDLLLLLVLLRQVQLSGQGDECCLQRFLRIGRHPQHKLVVIAKAIGILDCRLGLADAPRPLMAGG